MPLDLIKHLKSTPSRRLQKAAVTSEAEQAGNISEHKGPHTLEEEERAFRATDEDLIAEHESLVSGCPLNQEVDDTTSVGCPIKSHPYHFVPLKMGGNGGTHKPSVNSVALIDEVGGLSALEKMTSHFYNNAFKDATLDKFIRSHDDPHAKRFALWIHQKLTGSTVWDAERSTRDEVVEVAGGRTHLVHDRSSAHAAAWHSVKRPAHEVGRRFKLDECRVWMRLHLWALREVAGDSSPAFADYYVRFIGHFISVYEGSAPAFARDAYRWSEDPKNIQKYLDNGRQMDDVLGLLFWQALQQIPVEEAKDHIWPYIGTA